MRKVLSLYRNNNLYYLSGGAVTELGEFVLSWGFKSVKLPLKIVDEDYDDDEELTFIDEKGSYIYGCHLIVATNDPIVDNSKILPINLENKWVEKGLTTFTALLKEDGSFDLDENGYLKLNPYFKDWETIFEFMEGVNYSIMKTYLSENFKVPIESNLKY